MANPSNGAKFRAVTRVVGRQAGGNRWMRASYLAGSTFFETLLRTFHVLWHQVTAVFFLAFSLFLLLRIYPAYQSYTEGKTGLARPLLVLLFGLMFGYFGLSSFVRAAKRSQKGRRS